MNYSDTTRSDRSALTAHSLGRVLVSSLVLMLAAPALVVAVAHPMVAVAFAAGLLSGHVQRAAAKLFRRIERFPTDAGLAAR
jgi:Kef-type K+ transport system membrane component KefB